MAGTTRYRPLHDRVERDFEYHPATPDTGPKHDRVRRLCRALAHELAIEVPEGREQSLALTRLEEVMMWANAGIARNQVPPPRVELAEIKSARDEQPEHGWQRTAD